jgi:hypothetical protein
MVFTVAMVILEGQMPLLQERLMIEKLMVISAYALPALILLIICYLITKK